jgi:hypothetical protein
MTHETKPHETRRSKSKGGQGATRHHSPTSPDAIERLERDLKNVQLRKTGMHWQAIADELGYSSPGHAHDRFMAVMQDYPREDIDTARNLIADRHEACIAAMWPAAMEGQGWAVDRITRNLEALAKLWGANRPEKVEISAGATELDAALREWQQELEMRAHGQPVPQE